MNVARVLYPVKVLGLVNELEYGCVAVIESARAVVIRNYGKRKKNMKLLFHNY